MRRRFVRWAATLGLVAWLVRTTGCDPSSTGSGARDTDGDGLSDVEETTLYGTSPLLADTDGDGLSDYDEIVQKVFDPERAPLRFNPRVADLPMLQVEFVGPPLISFNVVDANGESRTFSITNVWGELLTDTSTAGVTVTEGETADQSLTGSGSRAISRTTAIADTAATPGDVSDTDVLPTPERSVDPVTVTITLGDTDTSGVSVTTGRGLSRQVSLSFTDALSRTIAREVSVLEAYTQSHNIAASGGILMVLAKLRNIGNVPYEVTNFMLTAALVLDDGVRVPVGNLDLLTRLTQFDPFSLSPGAEIAPINFLRDDLTLEQVADVLRNAQALSIEVGVTNLKDATGRPYNFHLPSIRARTATVDVDFGQRREPERYLVATNLDPARPGITSRRAFDDILRMPNACDPDAGALSVRDVGPDTIEGGSWCLFHRRSGDPEDRTTAYCPYDCSEIDLRAGDLLELVWNEP